MLFYPFNKLNLKLDFLALALGSKKSSEKVNPQHRHVLNHVMTTFSKDVLEVFLSKSRVLVFVEWIRTVSFAYTILN